MQVVVSWIGLVVFFELVQGSEIYDGFWGRTSTLGSYVRLMDSCITQLKVQGPSRTCNESKEEEGEHLDLRRSPRDIGCAMGWVVLEATQGQNISQSPTDATRFWWHLYGS